MLCIFCLHYKTRELIECQVPLHIQYQCSAIDCSSDGILFVSFDLCDSEKHKLSWLG